MAMTPQAEGRISEFRANGFDLSRERREYERGSDHEREDLRQDEGHAQQMLMGNLNASVGRQVIYAAQAIQARIEREEGERRRLEDDFILLALIEQGRVGAYVAGQVVDKMSDAEINTFVERIEAVTGETLETYATRLLGKAVAERRDGETDADYRRRMVDAIHAEVMEVAIDSEGNPVARIKDKYASDPYIRDIFTEGMFQKYRSELNKIENDPDAARKIRDFSERSYDAGDAVRSALKRDELAEDARRMQDVQADKEAYASGAVDASAAVLDDLMGDPGPREQASKAFRSAFEVSSKESSDETQAPDEQKELHNMKDAQPLRPV